MPQAEAQRPVHPAAVQMDLPEASQLSLDPLTRDWKIYQLRRGHRFSTDDLLTAWMAARTVPGAPLQLDLGAGIGSVGLLTLWRQPETSRLVMLEAQEVSHQLARKTVALNQLSDRVELRLGDLRDPALVPELGRYQLVTGSPPYIPPGRGVISPHPQRAACRVELRGGVFDYAEAAARSLHPEGRYVFCFWAADPRPEQAIEAAGLHLHRRLDVHFRGDRDPLIALFVAGHQRPDQVERPPPFFIRDAQLRWTEAYLDLRAEMGAVLERG